MALPALHGLSARVWDPLPDDLVSVDFGADDLLACIIVQATHEVHVVADSCKSGTLTRRWHPFWVEWQLHVKSKAFTLLHALDVRLKPAD